MRRSHKTAELVREINRTKALIVVEHDMQFIRMIAKQVTVFHQGGVLVEDTMENIMRNPQRARHLSRQAGGRMMLDVQGLRTPATAASRSSTASSFAVDEGEFVGILGHNGMGKTTLLKTLMGFLPATGGRVHVRPATTSPRAEPYRRARLGLGYVPQGREIFPGAHRPRQSAHGLQHAGGAEERHRSRPCWRSFPA